MKAIQITLLNFMFIVINISAQQTMHVIPSPTDNIGDIAFDGSYLWAHGISNSLIYKISIIDGTVLKTIPTNINSAQGLAFDGTHLWISDKGNSIIQRLDTLNGNIISSFSTPGAPDQSRLAGLAWDGNHLWINDNIGWQCFSVPDDTPSDTTYQADSNGQILQRFNSISDCPKGLAFDGEYLWSSDNETFQIYKIDTSSYSVIDSIDAPGGIFPNGLAYNEEEGYLFVANSQTDSIYLVDVGNLATSVSEIYSEQKGFHIFPNPSSGKFTFVRSSTLRSEKYSIVIFNSLGEIVLKELNLENGFKNIIDLSNLSSNIFYYRITLNNNKLQSGILIKE